MAEKGDTSDLVNGATEQRTSSKESSPIPSPTSDRKAKTGLPTQGAATLPAQTQEAPSAQMEGFLNRKHEWEAHNKKASSRWAEGPYAQRALSGCSGHVHTRLAQLCR